MANQPVIYFETSANTGDIYIDDVKITQTTGTQPQPDPQPDPQPNQGPTDQYMKNMKIDTFCPSNISGRRNGVTCFICFTWCFW